MTDRLTPGMLRDLADLWDSNEWMGKAQLFRQEAARREAEAKPQHATACEYPNCGCTARHLCKYKVEREGPGSAAAHDLYETGDPDTPDCVKDRNGDVVLGLCRKCGAGEIELLGPCKDKPVPAAYDLVQRLRCQPVFAEPAETQRRELVMLEAADRIEALTAEVSAHISARDTARDAANQFLAERDAEKARADRLAAAIRDIDRACNMAEVHRIAVDALASEGGRPNG